MSRKVKGRGQKTKSGVGGRKKRKGAKTRGNLREGQGRREKKDGQGNKGRKGVGGRKRRKQSRRGRDLK